MTDEVNVKPYHLHIKGISFIELIKHLSALPVENMEDVTFYGFLVASHPIEEKTKPNHHYQHENGRTKSINARWDLALKVDCPRCKRAKGLYCVMIGNDGTTPNPEFGIKYPHNQRTREALRQQQEAQMELP